MKFAAPQYLLWLIFPFLAWLAIRWDLRRQQESLGSWISPRLRERLLPGWLPSARLGKATVFCLALCFAFLALARPQWGHREEVIRARGVDVVLLLDVSRSMDVEDVVPSRMKKARHWIRNLVGRMPGNRVGVVAFASSSYVACPLTTDLDYVLETVDILAPSSVLNQGTDIGLGLSTALAAIERGAESPSDGAEQPELTSQAVILISDGEDHEAAFAEAAAQLAKKGVRLFVFGVGSEKGGPIPIRDETGRLEGYKRAGANPVISRFDSRSLERIAADANGKYWNMTDSESEVDEVLGALGALDRTAFQERKTLVPIERYQWPLSVAVLLFIVELALPLMAAQGRRKRAGGIAAGAVVASASLFLVSGSAEAAPVESYLKNREGLRSFSQEEMELAERKFGEAQSADPRQVEPQFNLGVAQLKKGDAKAAIHSFETAARKAGVAGDAGLSARAYYNLGAAYESEKQQGEALRSFAGAVRMAELAKDEELAKEARKRIQKLQEQSQQNQKHQGQQGQQGQSAGQQGDGEQKKQESGSGDQQQKEQPRQFEDPSVSRRREFKSDKMSREDTERVMAELSAREKELQSKLKKQRGTRQAGNDKDW